MEHNWRVVISTETDVYQTDAMYTRDKARILAGQCKRGEFGDALKVRGKIESVWAEQNEHGETVGPI